MARAVGCTCPLEHPCLEVLGKRMEADADDYYEHSSEVANALITAVPSEIGEWYDRFLCAMIRERTFHQDYVAVSHLQAIRRGS